MRSVSGRSRGILMSVLGLPPITEIYIIHGFTVDGELFACWHSFKIISKDDSGQIWYHIEINGQQIQVPASNVAAFRERVEP